MSLRRDTLWTAADAFVAAGLAFAFRLFVARILVPEDFGVAAMALTVIALLQVVIDLGFNAALVQKDEHLLTQRLIDSTFTAALIMSLSTAALTAFVIAPLAADYYGVPVVQSLVALAAVMLLPSPFSTVASAMMMRARRFKALAIIRCTTVFASIACAAVILWLKPGPWVVVGQAIAASAFNTIALQIASPRRYRLALHRGDLREVFGFSGFVVANDVAVAASANAGVVVLGRFAGASEVGMFSLATYIVDTTRRTLMSILSRVVLVHYSIAKHEPAKVREIFLTTLTWNCVAVFPVAVSIILYGPSLSIAFFGPEWGGMGFALICLSVSVMIHASGGTTATLFRAMGRPGLDLTIFLLTTGAIQIPAMLFGAYMAGLNGLAVAIAVTKFISILVRQIIVSRLVEGLAIKMMKRIILAAVLQSPIVAIWLLGSRMIDATSIFLVIPMAVGLAVYIVTAILAIVPRKEWSSWLDHLSPRKVAQ